jgi:hypothetical protein
MCTVYHESHEQHGSGILDIVMTTNTLTLTTLIADLPGAEPNTVAAMYRLGLRCVADLLLHMPTRYRRSRPWQAIGHVAKAADLDTTDDMEVRGEIVSVERGFGRSGKVEAVIEPAVDSEEDAPGHESTGDRAASCL